MIRVRLRDVLAEHDLSAYRLAKQVRGVSPKTVYAVSAGRAGPSLEALDHILTALRELTGEALQPGDLLEYIPPPEPMTPEDRAWLETDLSRLSDFEPYDWGPEGPPAGQPIRYVPGLGAVIDGEKQRVE
jgi:DNA-binding XRE family transcriptional regulator